jgi:hypothetical protein
MSEKLLLICKLQHSRASPNTVCSLRRSRVRLDGGSTMKTLRQVLRCEARGLHCFSRASNMADVWYMTLNYSRDRLACQKLKKFRGHWKCTGTQVHFEVMSDLLLQSEIRPIIHLKGHLSAFYRRRSVKSGKVCSDGVQTSQKRSLLLCIFHWT